MNQYAKYDMPQLVALFEQELRDDFIGWGYRQWIEERASDSVSAASCQCGSISRRISRRSAPSSR
jgi:hypothetical protein